MCCILCKPDSNSELLKNTLRDLRRFASATLPFPKKIYRPLSKHRARDAIIGAMRVFAAGRRARVYIPAMQTKLTVAPRLAFGPIYFSSGLGSVLTSSARPSYSAEILSMICFAFSSLNPAARARISSERNSQ